TRDEDFVVHIFSATNHNYLLIFTEQGKCYWMRVFEIPEGTKVGKGRAIQNLINIASNDKIKAIVNVKDLADPEYLTNNYIVLCTRKGTIKKTSLEAYSRPRQNGIIAININEGDELIEANLTNGKSEVIIGLQSGKAIRFNEATVRPMMRNASGVKAITLASADDCVVGMVCVDDENSSILVVSENGFGKRSPVSEYRVTNRGGKGVKSLNITDKTGAMIALVNVVDNDDLMIINKSGMTIRMPVASLRDMGRATQGVRLIALKNDDAIAAITKVDSDGIEDADIIETNAPETTVDE
ncbi:MAG TPA: DNA gyrase subunit A, partial [Bacteroidales bacterium]|nr:DNA gyrase subunit A [Bacteroidales bacterium]